MKVVHIRSHAFTHYIGRGWMPKAPTGKVQPVQAGLGNPFVIDGLRTRARAIEEYEAWARSQAGIMERIKALPEDAVLGCWCRPQPCHGDVIIKIWKELHNVQP